MTDHTAPDPTEMNSFGALVVKLVTGAEHFELSSKRDNSARRAAITPRTPLSSVELPVEYCSGGSGVLRSWLKAHESTSVPPPELQLSKSVPGSRVEGEECVSGQQRSSGRNSA